MGICPICNSEASEKYKSSPYWVCPSCDCWFQSPLPEKVYEAAHEKTSDGDFAGHLMSDNEKQINDNLAHFILSQWFENKPIKTLDVGSKYPYLAYCFKNLGCESYGMDNIEIVPEYSKELDIPMLMADFEQISEETITDWTRTDKFDLITMVHVFEHMENPLGALRKLRALLKDDGYLFLRLPQHDVEGFERDLTVGHFTIHPFFHSLSSILECLVQTEDLFTVQWDWAIPGGGQRDIVLKPIKKKPSLVCGMIVKNEERDLPKCLKSIEDIVDSVVIIDTGSTDQTIDVALNTINKPVMTVTYTGASSQNESGDWQLWDFAQARNEFVKIIDTPDSGADYLIWMDADDVLLTPKVVKRALYQNNYDTFGMMMQTDIKWVHHRMWKTGRSIVFDGAIHEYPVLNGVCQVLQDCVISHDAAPGIGESSNQRNLRILEKEFEHKQDSRTAFYLANTHKDGGRWLEAVEYYNKRIEMGEFFRDEWLFAYLYKARCQRVSGNTDGAESTLLEALSKAPNWSEFWMELAYIYFDSSRWDECISMCLSARAKPITHTSLWRETNKYTDQPLRMMSFCLEHLGKFEEALKCAMRAVTVIGSGDESWNNYVASLQTKARGSL